MAEATRWQTIYQIQQVLKAYKAKLETASTYRDCLSAEGKALTDDYMSENSETRWLIEDAVNKPEFFLDMEDDALIQYSDVCIKLNKLLRLKVSGVEKIDKIVDSNFFITSDAKRITSLAEVELGRIVTYNVGESARIDANDILNQWLYDVEWEVEDMGGNFDEATAKKERLFEMQLKLTSLGEYKIRARIYKGFGHKKDLYDVIEFDQLVTEADEEIAALPVFEKFKKALGMVQWKQRIDIETLLNSLWNSLPMIIFMAALILMFGEVAASLIALMSLADGGKNITDGFTKVMRGFEIVRNAGSENALKHGGELIHEGLMVFGLGTIEVFLSKCTMENVRAARGKLLKGEVKALAQSGTKALPPAATGEVVASYGMPPALMEKLISERMAESARITSMALANVSANQSEMAILENINKGIAEIENLSVKGSKYNPCPDSSPYAKNAVEVIEIHNQFVWNESEAKWLSPDGKRKIWFENVWKYEGENGIVEEFSVYQKYSLAKGTTPTLENTNKSFMNGHHGIQSDWAEKRINSFSKKIMGKNIYKKNDAPAILLRDTNSGTPHQVITKNQKTRERDISDTDFEYQRKKTLEELSDIGCPKGQINEYLSMVDDYFKSLYMELQKIIKNSSFTNSEKETFKEELKNIFGNYFEK